MRLLLLVMTVIVLVIGVVTRDSYITMTGVGVFILYQAVDLIIKYRQLKRSRNIQSDKEPKKLPKDKKQLVDKVADKIEVIVTFGGLVMMPLGQPIAGMLIWVVFMLCFLADGFMFQDMTGIQTRMGWGGWYIPRGKRQSSSLHSKSYNKYIGRK